MKYYEVKFNIQPYSDDAADIVAAIAGEAGFESFDTADGTLTGYVQQPLFDEPLLRQLLDACPLPDVTVTYTVGEAEDRDWNEQWEQEGFEPIFVEERGTRSEERGILIHDGRHLPKDYSPSSFFAEQSGRAERLVPPSSKETSSKKTIAIEIDAHLAFGTGTHETTRMMCGALLEQDLTGKRVLDCGTGTGILAIAALKLGAREAVGYDIDEWSVDNARHNAVINGVDDRLTALLGDASILIDKVKGTFDIVMANINRNILLADMAAFVTKMAPGATLLLSGFYTEDVPLLVAKAEELGLTLTAQREDENWAELSLDKR
jgi:ribosomal protein L11 methyltransferase